MIHKYRRHNLWFGDIKIVVRFYLVVFSLCVYSYSTAQIQHIENRRIYTDSVKWSGASEANFSAVQNKELLIDINVMPFVQYRDTMNYFLGLGNYRYSMGNKLYAHSLLFHFRYNRYLHKDIRWMMWEWYTQAQINPLLSQRIRALAGTGPRFRLFEDRRYKLYSGLSYMYEYEEIIVDTSIQRNHRGSFYLSWFLTPKSFFSVSGSTYAQPLLDNFADYRISGQYTISYRINSYIRHKIEFGFLYDSRPPSDVRHLIFDMKTGVIVDFINYRPKPKKQSPRLKKLTE